MVEDQPALRLAVRDLLIEKGFQVDVAGDGSHAMEAVNRAEPDVVLMDMRLPDTDGIECTIRIKATCPTAQVIAFSSYDDPGTKKLMAEQGVFRYLVKGVSIASIVEAVTEALEHKREMQPPWER